MIIIHESSLWIFRTSHLLLLLGRVSSTHALAGSPHLPRGPRSVVLLQFRFTTCPCGPRCLPFFPLCSLRGWHVSHFIGFFLQVHRFLSVGFLIHYQFLFTKSMHCNFPINLKNVFFFFFHFYCYCLADGVWWHSAKYTINSAFV